MRTSPNTSSLIKLKFQKEKLLAKLKSIRKTRSSTVKIQYIQHKIVSLSRKIDSISSNFNMPALKYSPLPTPQNQKNSMGLAFLPKPLQDALSQTTSTNPNNPGSTLPNPHVALIRLNNDELNSVGNMDNIIIDTDGACALSPSGLKNPNKATNIENNDERSTAIDVKKSSGTIPKTIHSNPNNESDSSRESFRNFDFRPSTPVSLRKLREYMEKETETEPGQMNKHDLPNHRPAIERKKLEFSSSSPPRMKENVPSHPVQSNQLPQNQMPQNQLPPNQMYYQMNPANNSSNFNPMNNFAHFNMNAFNPYQQYQYMNQFLPFMANNFPNFTSFLPNPSSYNGYVYPMHQGHNNQMPQCPNPQQGPDTTTQHTGCDSRNFPSQQRTNRSSSHNLYTPTHHNYDHSNRNTSHISNDGNGNQSFSDQNPQCRKTFMKYLESIPLFSGQSREDLMNFIEISDTINAFCTNEVEYVEFITKITFQLRGEARSVLSNGTNWADIKNALLSKFQYLSNRTILDSQIENLRQAKDENLTKYAERTRKLLAEKNKSFYSLSEEQKTEHDRIARKFFARGLENRKLRDIMVIQGCPSLEETIGRSLEIENELVNTISQQEFNCTYCKRPGHRATECRSKQNNSSPIGQLASILQNLSFQNNQQQPNNWNNSNKNNSFGNNNNNANYGRNGSNNNNANYGRYGSNNSNFNQNNSNPNNQRNYQNGSNGFPNNYPNNNSGNYSNNNSSNYPRNNSNNSNYNNNQRGNSNYNQNRPNNNNNNQEYHPNSNNNVRSVTFSDDTNNIFSDDTNNPNTYSTDNYSEN